MIRIFQPDGNLTADGRWTYTWDAENRLTQVAAISSVPSGAKRKLQFAYDHVGRRVEKKVFDWNGSSYNASPSTHIKFANDGWRPVAELNGSTGAVVRSYCWGKDLSGSLKGAGGIGGLLMVREGGATYAARYDANGNLVGFYNLTDDNVALRVEYGPYGQLLTSRGYYTSCPFRFSTKYQDSETGLYYFGYRYYNAETGRWLSRDA